MAPGIVILEVTRVHSVKTLQCWEHFIIQNVTIGLCVHATTDKHQQSHAEGRETQFVYLSVTQSRRNAGGGGGTVAERLAHSPPTKANRAQSPAGPPDFRKWESCRTMPLVGGFSQGSPVSPVPSFRRRSIFTSVTLIGSQDLAVKSRPNLFTDVVTARRISNGLFFASLTFPRSPGCRRHSGQARLLTLLFLSGRLYSRRLAPRSRGGVVVRTLASHRGEAGSIPGGVAPGFSHVEIVEPPSTGLFAGRSSSSRSCIPPLLHLRFTLVLMTSLLRVALLYICTKFPFNLSAHRMRPSPHSVMGHKVSCNPPRARNSDPSSLHGVPPSQQSQVSIITCSFRPWTTACAGKVRNTTRQSELISCRETSLVDKPSSRNFIVRARSTVDGVLRGVMHVQYTAANIPCSCSNVE
ncbi:hypothetical protein PR048_020512 [Dryococelus australis]|uniref:Uncharacterized protein n=1 Tax=Dryococelus australis TaxID=614101 RepID=A0ABQ9H6J6_9NEOP|nr:hypothetical protein PR048_020512 [Dryococelus australis]